MTAVEQKAWADRCRDLHRRLAELEPERYGGPWLTANLGAIRKLATRGDYAAIRSFAIRAELLVARKEKRAAESR